MSDILWGAIIGSVPVLLGTLWAAIKGIATALRWWADREEARITNDVLGKQAVATVMDKNRELDDIREQLRQCLARNGPAT